MAKIDQTIPSLGPKFVDLRDSLPGNAYSWSWERSLSEIKYLAIHHTAAPDTQTPQDIANFHINSNGWGGIGYHFLISKDGTVYYVGDITTARANVANLNEAVIGICLIGNFTSGRVPTDEQIESAKKLCDFFINIYPELPNVNGWETVKGHKELPGQATTCPGDDWLSWKVKIISGGGNHSSGGGTSPNLVSSDRGNQISELYKNILGRDSDIGGLQTYTNSPQTIDEVARILYQSLEHQNLISNARQTDSLKSQVESLQTTLASLNQNVISLKEVLHERENEIAKMKSRLVSPEVIIAPSNETDETTDSKSKSVPDTTLTIIQALFNLYKFIFWPRKVD